MTTNDGIVLGATQIFGSAPRSRAFNLVLLAEGFTTDEQTGFNTVADLVVTDFLKISPFSDFSAVINVFRINVTSTDSGADDPVVPDGGTGGVAKTYFDATFGHDKIRRLLVSNTATALSVAAAQVPEFSAAMVVVNSSVYGGSGGSVGTFSLASGASEIAVHEMGHSVFGLADEYACLTCTTSEKGQSVHPDDEPHQPNVTTNKNRNTLKWRWGVSDQTPIPTMTNPNCATTDPRSSPVAAGTIGTFEGADHYHCNVFRSEFDCKMRTFGSPFCRVCQQVIRDRLFPLTTLAAQGRTPLTAVAKDSASVDIFAVASDSRTVTDHWDIASGFGGWSQISGGATSPGGTGSPVTAISRSWDRIDVFTVGGDGHVWFAWWGNMTGWSQWTQVGTLTVRRGSTVTAIARRPETIDLFTTAQDGSIMWTWASSSHDWAEWSHISGGHAPAGAVVTANSRWDWQMDVFTVGTDNQVWTASWLEGSVWSPWSQPGNLVARPDSTVTVVSHGVILELFTTAADGSIMTTTTIETGQWTGAWSPVSGGHASPGSPVTALVHRSDHVDLFVVGSDNGIYANSRDIGSDWTGWSRIANGNAVPGSQIAAVARFPEHLDLYVVGGDSLIYTAGRDWPSGWSASWFPVGVS